MDAVREVTCGMNAVREMTCGMNERAYDHQHLTQANEQ
jgi:hypothetical protein